jgi:hypothetical protein
MFCGQSLESLRGEGINEADNIMICESAIHRLQGRLQLAFEEVQVGFFSCSRMRRTPNYINQSEPDTYTVVTYGKKAGRLRVDGRRVVFHDHSNKNVKLVSFFRVCAFRTKLKRGFQAEPPLPEASRGSLQGHACVWTSRGANPHPGRLERSSAGRSSSER